MSQLLFNYHHVVIIDDNQSDIFILKDTLKTHNCAEYISTFDNSVSAYNFLKKCQIAPDVIFIDLNMPGVGGFDFIKRFTNDFFSSTKFVITSYSDDPRDLEMASTFSNIAHYFVKPINIQDLSALQQKK